MGVLPIPTAQLNIVCQYLESEMFRLKKTQFDGGDMQFLQLRNNTLLHDIKRQKKKNKEGAICVVWYYQLAIA